jgi:hypothetical protein
MESEASASAKRSPPPVKHTAGYLSSFVFENQEALTEITRIAEETMNDFAQ